MCSYKEPLYESDLEKALRELFRYAFITNCHLDNFQVGVQELNALDTIRSMDVLEGFKELVLVLLKQKRDLKQEKKGKENSNDKSAQKLEGEIKNRIRTEQQLKETIEFYKKKLEESEEKCCKLNKRVKELEGTLPTEPSPILEFASKKKFQNLSNMYSSYDGPSMKKIEVYKDSQNSKGNFQVLKQKLEQKSKEIIQIQEKIREKINNSSSPQRSRVFAVPFMSFEKVNKEENDDEFVPTFGKSNTARCITTGIRKINSKC